MKKKVCRSLSLMLAVVMMLSVFSVTALATEIPADELQPYTGEESGTGNTTPEDGEVPEVDTDPEDGADLEDGNGSDTDIGTEDGEEPTDPSEPEADVPVVLDAVKMNSATAHSSGIIVRWDAVEHATLYIIYRKSGESDWTELAKTSGTAYKDTTAAFDTTYSYTVRAFDGTNMSAEFDQVGVSATMITPLANVVMDCATAHDTGIIVRWNAVEGATCYTVYRRTENSEWVAWKNTTGTALKDTTAEKDVTYYYTVRAFNATQSSPSYDPAGVSAMIIGTLGDVVMNSASAYPDGILIRWTGVSNAVYYEVYRHAADETGWTHLRNTGSLAFKDTTAEAGVKYYYKVRARSGSVVSSLDIAAVSAVIAMPENVVMQSAAAYKDGILVRWEAAEGASLYQLYRRAEEETTWSRICTTGSIAYKDKTAEPNVKYYYKTVGCNGGMVSSLDIAAVSATLVIPADVRMISAKDHKSGIIVSWEASEGAELYHVYRRAETETSWKLIANTGSVAYKDTTAKHEVEYFYKVVARIGGVVSSMDIDAVSAMINPHRAMDEKAAKYSSPTDYLVLVDKTTHKVGVYTGSKGNWRNIKFWDCGDGTIYTPTVEGVFSVGIKMYYFDSGSARCFYATQFYGNYLFHSVLYAQTSTPQYVIDGTVGAGVSHGCVRLRIDNAKWIYDNIPAKTTVVVYRS